MKKQFTPVDDKKTLEELLVRSHTEPVIVFKHSTTCPISAAAYAEMSEVSNDVSLVVVQSARDVSREIEARTGLRHESPQALVLRSGEVVWNASHYDITEEAVKQAVEANR